MVGWHQPLNGHGFEQVLGDGKGQGGLVCYIPRGGKELDTTEQLNNKGFQHYLFQNTILIKRMTFLIQCLIGQALYVVPSQVTHSSGVKYLGIETSVLLFTKLKSPDLCL